MGLKTIKSGVLIFGVSFLLLNCSPSYDVVILDGMVVDGTGSSPYQVDVGVENKKIESLGDLKPSQGETVIYAQGKYVVPGFIDIHTHADRQLDEREGKKALNYITQGVSTVVTGNCGSGTYRVDDFFERLEEQKSGVNVVHLVGHGTVRRKVMGYDQRAPTEKEMQKMKSLIKKAMEEDAVGLSTGLFYAPGSYAKTEEIVSLCQVVQKYGGFYATHIRDESNYSVGLKSAVQEAIQIGEESGVRVQISHIKALGRPVWGQSEEVCQIIEKARKRGVNVYADQYPYTASSTSLAAAVVPRWVQAEGKMRKRLKNPRILPKIKKEMARNIQRRGGAHSLVVSSFSQKPDWEGQSLQQISASQDKSPVESALFLCRQGNVGVVSFNMKDEDVEYFMKKPYVMTCSDGSIPQKGEGLPHPRCYGTFPRKIKTYVLDRGVINMEHAIRAATGLPAQMLRLEKRGLIKENYIADVVVFDPKNIEDRATFSNPHQYSQGIEFMWINGKMVIQKGELTGILAGEPLRPSPADH